MTISLNWLKEYLSQSPDPEKIAELLTGCGLEVESLEHYQSVKGGLEGVVIGEVLTCVKHPNSDHLSLTEVNIGKDEPLHVVCGASNVKAGQKVAVATVGTMLYFKDQEIKIQKSKIRGEVSEGMICAEDELGLGNSHEGIMVLDPFAIPGTPAREYFNVYEDTILEIGLTPNRADAASHLGIARDLVAVLHADQEISPAEKGKITLKYPDVNAFKQDNRNRVTEIVIEDVHACPRYTGLTMTGVTVKESPQWLKEKLLAIGQRPINNIVDITNFVLHELGQPLHAFDADRIAGNKVVVKKLPKGTKFITLDEIERELTENDLMICDAEKPMVIGGVFGGILSGVTFETKNIFIESACFDPKTIRKTSKYHGLQTDASFRFERGTDIGITIYALKRAAILIKEVAGGEVSSEIIDVYPAPVEKRKVELSFSHLDRLIGKAMDRELVKRILVSLGIEIISETGQSLLLQIPFFKVDVTREADVIEEVLRIYGYNNIEIPVQVRSSVSHTTLPDERKIQNLVSEYLCSNGFFEIMNNSLTRSSYYDGNEEYGLESAVKIYNPLSRDLDVMRQTLLYNGLEAIVYNQNRKILNQKLFEFGTVYRFSNTANGDPLNKYQERKLLAVFMTGSVMEENWTTRERPVNFFDLKSLVNNIMLKTGINISALEVEKKSSPGIREGLVYRYEGNDLAYFGQVSPGLGKKFDCRHDVFYADFNWESIISFVPVKDLTYREMPKFPEVRRDLALLVDESVSYADIEKVAYSTEKRLLKRVGLFDVYEGEKIDASKKSYAVSFILQDDQKTLTDAEIDKVMSKLIKAFEQSLGARTR